MKRPAALFLLIFSMVVTVSAERGSFSSERAKARLYPYANDLGPDQVDVSGYSPQMQITYQRLILGKCSRCHGASRILNSEFVQPDVWKLYVKRMAAKPGTGIEPDEVQKIVDFLIYDSKKRKTGESSRAWEAHRQKLLSDFKRKHPFRYKELYEAR